MLYKNVALQKIHVYAYDSTTGAAKTGDAANITAYISLDGTADAVDDTNPTEVDAMNMPGVYVFDLAQAETNCNSFALYAKSSTSNIRLEPIIGFTVGADASLKVDTTKIGGTTQTARDLGASVLLSPGTGTGQISLTSGAVTVGTNNDKTGYTASTVSDKTGYSLTQAFPSNFSALAITAGGIVQADLQTIKTQAITCAAPVTVYAAVGTAYLLGVDSANRCGTVVNLINAATAGDLTATMKASINAEADTALSDVNLDHLVGTPTGIPALPAGTWLDILRSDGTATYDRTTDSLQAVRDRGDAAWGGAGSSDWTADEKTAIRAILGVPASGTAPADPTTGILDTLRDYIVTVVSQTVDTYIRSAVGLTTNNLASLINSRPTAAENAAAWGTYDMGNGRTREQALARLRNKVALAAGVMTVYDTTDTTPLWTASVTSDATAQPVVSIDPT